MDDKKDGKPHRGRPYRGKRLKTSLPRPETDAALPPGKDGERIARAIARAGLCSRREAEAWIAAGRVSVNGEAIASPALNVTQKDRIAVDGKPLPQRERTRLFLFHKPRGLVTTSADPQGRPTIFGALPKDMPRLISVGRLDLNTEGLLLLTNDGGLARALELPSTGWLRRYRVRAFGKIAQTRLDGLRNGIEVDGVRYGAIEAAIDREQGDNVWITFAMREGKNREIRNVLRALGLQVNRLIRVSYGPFQLGELPDGGVEEVRTRTLRDQLGERIAALAGADFSGPLVERETPEPPVAVRATRHPQARVESHRGGHKRDDKPRGSAGRGSRPATPSKDGGRPRHAFGNDSRKRAKPDTAGGAHGNALGKSPGKSSGNPPGRGSFKGRPQRQSQDDGNAKGARRGGHGPFRPSKRRR